MAWTTPKTNWATGELVTAEDMNAVGENLAVLRHPSTAVAAYTTTEDIVLPGTDSFADIDSDNLNLTITTSGGDVLVQFHGSLSGGSSCILDVEIDGNRHGDTEHGVMDVYGWKYTRPIVSFTRLIQNLSAGSHTFKLQAKSSLTLVAGAQFWVREL
ncbi:MAG: hypothetical protein OXG78_16610 [Chloroflexi bacterium]|nr:hypothetical protein [Chloroflexota bacterium]